MRAAFAILVLVGACDAADPDVRIERQASSLASASADGWAVGGAVLVGIPGSFSFPQPVALRISLVDANTLDGDGPATLLPLDGVNVETFGTAAGDVKVEPTCDAMVCTAELSVLEAGSIMLAVRATAADGVENDCFFYGVYEDADPATVSDGLRTELEAQQLKCRNQLNGYD